MLARRDCFETYGLFAPELPQGADLDWFIRAREAGIREVLVDEVLGRRRLHGDNMSIREFSASHSEHLTVLRDALRRRRCARP